MAAALEAVADLHPGLDDRTRARVETAVWFHDAVYDPRAADNEERSARLAADGLSSAGVPAEDGTEVARLVRLTAAHSPPAGDPGAAALLDADLAVLGAEPSAYDAYRWAIRQEFGFVPEPEFARRRLGVLRTFLAAPSIYTGLRARRRLEASARANLAREVGELSALVGE